MSDLLWASPIISWEGKRYKRLQEYKAVHKKFRQQLCRPGTEEHFNKLNRNYLGDGFFVPLLANDKIDKVVIKKYLSEILIKSKWIERQHQYLSTIGNFKQFQKNLQGLIAQLDEILKKKEAFYATKKTRVRSKITTQSSLLIKKFTFSLGAFLEKVSFLQGYHFPVDHFKLRKDYDSLLGSTTITDQHKKNDIYFYRKMVEDGAQDPDHKKSDAFFRAGLNSIVVNLKDESGIISEKLRYDLDDEFSRLEKYLKWGKERHLERLIEWRDRIKRKHHFYKNLVSNDFSQIEKTIIDKKSKALHALKKFVYTKQAEVFKFWSEQSVLMRALYVMETILFNEVGGVDGHDALERWDVLQVIINRLHDSNYNTIGPDSDIFQYIKKSFPVEIKKYPWLNVLFKRGEFSFTYYFIPMNVRVFCPDMTRRGRFLRKENLKLSLKKLKKPDPNFRALRYFSRASMVGKVDMALLWSNFRALPERPGLRAKRSRALKLAYKKGQYRFLYPFRDDKNRLFRVLEFKKSIYVLRPMNLRFYRYRNPHLFTYFELK